MIAILTILGFSLYDTVVIYDKIQENTESTGAGAQATATRGSSNMSLNQVFMRSVNTSLVVLMPILSLLLFGGEHAEGLRVRDVHRRPDRRVLVDLRRGAGAGGAEGARAAVPPAPGANGRPRGIKARRAETASAATPAAGAAAATVSTAAATRTTARTGTSQRPRPKSKRKPPAKRKRR